MIFPRVVLGEGGLELPVDLDEVFAVGVGCQIDRDRKCCSLENLSHDVHFAKFGGGQLSDRVAEVRSMIDQSLTDQCLEGFSHRNSAHSEQFRHFVEWNRGIRWSVAGENYPPQFS